MTIIDKYKKWNLISPNIWKYRNEFLSVSNYLGHKIRELREKKNLLLRQVAAYLEVDTALMSKIERGDRNANKDQALKIAEFLEVEADELLTLWLADKLATAVGEEKKLARDAMDIVKKKLKK